MKSMRRLLNRSVSGLAVLVYAASPRLKDVLAGLILRISVGDTLISVYGVELKKNWPDVTFRLCARGHYGWYFSDFLKSLPFRFSFLDIGANLGLYSLVASRNSNLANVYAFEPNPYVQRFLEDNAALNDAPIKIYPVAIGDTDGEQLLYFDKSHTGAGGLKPAKGGRISVQCRNFAVFNEIQSVDANTKVVKIDVEGYEPVVLQQLLRSTLAPSIRYIYFEADETRYNVEALRTSLEQHGFRLLHQEGRGAHYDLMYERD